MFKAARKWRSLVLILVALVALVVVLLVMRVQASRHLGHQTEVDAVPMVKILVAEPGSATEEIVLPGTVKAWHEATIYARTNGYIKKWLVDIGAKVKAGDLLAVIESPEVDAQLRQAEADLNTAIANSKQAQLTSSRWAALSKKSFVSQQAADERASSAVALAAAEVAAYANRDRLRQLVGFERVIAPFDGIISSRTTDIGTLINAGSSTTAVPLFHIVQASPLRIYVNIPQTYASSIKPSMAVTLTFAEHPNKNFSAKLFDTAKAIDPRTLTLQAQFTTENSKGELLPGGYTMVHFKMPLSTQLIRLPVNTILFRSEGLQVATVDKDNKVLLKPIAIRRDFGEEVEVESGIKLGDRIILNPADSLANGQKVRFN